jgi:hypothetical protein
VLQVVDGGREAERIERLARRGVAQLRLVAEGEQRLLTAGGRAPAGDVQDLVGREIGRG